MKVSVDVQTSTINVPAILGPYISAPCVFSQATLHGSTRSALSRKAVHHRVAEDVVIVAVVVVAGLAAEVDLLADAGETEAAVEAAGETGGEREQAAIRKSMRAACRMLAPVSMHTSCTVLAENVHERLRGRLLIIPWLRRLLLIVPLPRLRLLLLIIPLRIQTFVPILVMQAAGVMLSLMIVVGQLLRILCL